MPRSFFVPGIPAPQGSKSFKGIHGGKAILVESSISLPEWRKTVATTARQWGAQLIPDGPVALALQFVMYRPKRTPKTVTPPAIKKPDLDKLERAILDALTGIAWRDDSQVTRITAGKIIAGISEQPGVWINYDARDAGRIELELTQ